MAVALGLARRGLGLTWPNPAVGCVLVRPDLDADLGGRVVGRGWTQPGGRPHAETEALRRAGDLARGATAYVTLEPCCHQGKTGPCTEALIKAGVARVVAAMEDPNPDVAGGGMAALKAAGIKTDLGLMTAAALKVNQGFVLRMTEGRPLVTLKTATSRDGFIAKPDGRQIWITGEAARARGHLLRAQHDAIMIGIGTVRADDPELTCRLPGMADRTPVRVIVASDPGVIAGTKLAATASAKHPVWVVTASEGVAAAARIRLPGPPGIDIRVVAGDAGGRPVPEPVLQKLAGEGITRLLIEGGSALARSFVDAGLIDRVAWFQAPDDLGVGIPAIAGADLRQVLDAGGFISESTEQIGPDRLEILAAPKVLGRSDRFLSGP